MLKDLTNDEKNNTIKTYYIVRQIRKKDALKQMFRGVFLLFVV